MGVSLSLHDTHLVLDVPPLPCKRSPWAICGQCIRGQAFSNTVISRLALQPRPAFWDESDHAGPPEMHSAVFSMGDKEAEKVKKRIVWATF
jgi:hypothetical protein